MSPGKHAPSSPSSFYASLGRHAAGAVAVVAVVALVIAMATRDDTGGAIGGPTVSPTGSSSIVESPSGSPVSSPTATETQRAPRERGKITVTVLNASGRAGLASATSERIVQAGFVVRTVDNAEPREKTVIFFRSGFRPEAELLFEDFPDLLRVKTGGKNPEVDAETMITVILGEDYRT